MKTDKQTRRAFIRGLTRAAFATVGIVAAYFVLPLDKIAEIKVWLLLPLALVGFAVIIGVEVRGILRAHYPVVRAVEALARDVPLFLVLFAATYYTMGHLNPSAFNESLTRMDALYFSMTVFSTVGFGDIAGVTQQARLAVTIQMAADLIVIGFGLKIITSAVQRRRHHDDETAQPLDGPVA